MYLYCDHNVHTNNTIITTIINIIINRRREQYNREHNGNYREIIVVLLMFCYCYCYFVLSYHPQT